MAQGADIFAGEHLAAQDAAQDTVHVPHGPTDDDGADDKTDRHGMAIRNGNMTKTGIPFQNGRQQKGKNHHQQENQTAGPEGDINGQFVGFHWKAPPIDTNIAQELSNVNNKLQKNDKNRAAHRCCPVAFIAVL
jgi:hypothetical protein